jgi:hypothetical protein
MESEKIELKGKEYYVNAQSLDNPQIKKLFLFDDPQLSKVSKDLSGMTRMVNKQDIEEKLRESVGGAGYSVWGGGGGSFGNPSSGGRVYGRGFGFGQGSSQSGGPNLMYTYAVKPLDPILQQKPTTQAGQRYVHAGSEIEGKVLGRDKKVHGKIIHIKKDSEGNILHYEVQELDTARKFEVDPTSITLLSQEDMPTAAMMDFVGENYYPSFRNFLKESRKKEA